MRGQRQGSQEGNLEASSWKREKVEISEGEYAEVSCQRTELWGTGKEATEKEKELSNYSLGRGS